MELETIDTKISNQTDDDNNQNNNEYQNLNDSIDAPPEIIYTSQSNKQKSKSALSQKVSEFIEVFKKYSQKVQMYIVLGVIVSFISIITKLYIVVKIWMNLIPKITSLKLFIDNLLYHSIFALPLYHLNNVFLIIGLVIFSLQPFLELGVRLKFLTKPFDTKIYMLLINKIWFFVCLGLIPETSMTMFKFQNRKNFILPFFIAKIYLQPILFVSLTIYAIVLLNRFRGRNRREKLKKHFMIYKRVFTLIINSKPLLWNNFRTEPVATQTSIRTSQNTSTSSSDDNLIQNPLIVVKKRHIAFMILFSILLSPILNGVFGYGYYIFFFRDEVACLFFKIDVLISALLTVIIVKIVQ